MNKKKTFTIESPNYYFFLNKIDSTKPFFRSKELTFNSGFIHFKEVVNKEYVSEEDKR